MPYDEYLRIRQLNEREVVYRFDRLYGRMRRRNEAIPEGEVSDDVRLARDEARSRQAPSQVVTR